MLKALLKNNIRIIDSVDSWEDGIREAIAPLLSKGAVEARYADKVIANINELGAYMVLTDGVIMPHARPEDGVLETSMALLRVDQGVAFPEQDHPVHLFFALAATDGSTHLDAIVALATLLESEENITALMNSATVDDMYKLI